MDSYKLKRIIFIGIIVIVNIILISITASSVMKAVIRELKGENTNTNTYVGELEQETNTNSTGDIKITKVLEGINRNMELILKIILLLISIIILIISCFIIYNLR